MNPSQETCLFQKYFVPTVDGEQSFFIAKETTLSHQRCRKGFFPGGTAAGGENLFLRLSFNLKELRGE
jgi:hypothetical protein